MDNEKVINDEVFGAYIVSYDFSSDGSKIVVVGEKRDGGAIHIVNVFTEEDAEEIISKIRTSVFEKS